ncbi:MAG: hypothetical protein U0900_20980 [Myxococcota bacterium]
MRRIEVVQGDGAFVEGRAPVPGGRLVGVGRSRLESPLQASIWMCTALFEAGATLAWDAAHGEEAFYVEQGEVAIDDRVCPAGSAIILEAKAAPTLRALAPSRVLHMGAYDETPPRAAARGSEGVAAPAIHVVGPRGVYEAIEPGRAARFFADATCPTCSVWLLLTSRSIEYESPIHSHAQDELIHLLSGEIRIGSLTLRPGDTVFIAADQVYRFRSGPEGFAFLNYRRAASLMTIRPTGQTIVENGASTGMVRIADATAAMATTAAMTG